MGCSELSIWKGRPDPSRSGRFFPRDCWYKDIPRPTTCYIRKTLWNPWGYSPGLKEGELDPGFRTNHQQISVDPISCRLVARWGPLTTISGFIPSYTHLQPWSNRVCWGYNYLIARGAPSCGCFLPKRVRCRFERFLPWEGHHVPRGFLQRFAGGLWPWKWILAWMSRWKLGSMVSKWVISPTYKWDIPWGYNPLILTFY